MFNNNYKKMCVGHHRLAVLDPKKTTKAKTLNKTIINALSQNIMMLLQAQITAPSVQEPHIKYVSAKSQWNLFVMVNALRRGMNAKRLDWVKITVKL